MKLILNSVISHNANECEFGIHSSGEFTYAVIYPTYKLLCNCNLTNGFKGFLEDVLPLNELEAEYVNDAAVAWSEMCKLKIYEE